MGAASVSKPFGRAHILGVLCQDLPWKILLRGAAQSLQTPLQLLHQQNKLQRSPRKHHELIGIRWAVGQFGNRLSSDQIKNQECYCRHHSGGQRVDGTHWWLFWTSRLRHNPGRTVESLGALGQYESSLLGKDWMAQRYAYSNDPKDVPAGATALNVLQ